MPFFTREDRPTIVGMLKSGTVSDLLKEIEKIKDRLTLSVLNKAITLSTPKACQPIEISSDIIKAANRYNKK